jgi:thiol-disulfide isomerase/thioredoxin
MEIFRMLRFVFASMMLVDVICFAAAADEPEPRAATADSKLAEIRSEIDATVERYSTALRTAKSDAESQAAVDRYLKELFPRLDEVLEWADAHPKNAETADALRLIINKAAAGPTNHSERALERLVRDHPDDPKASEITVRVAGFSRWPITPVYLTSVLERNPLEKNKAAACFALGEYHELRSRLVRRMKSDESYRKAIEENRGVETVRSMLESIDPERSDDEAIRYFQMSADRFGDLIFYEKMTYAAAAKGRINSIRNLAIGKVAPEIVGRDVDGKSFSLSDYRGKVVLLTFSGNWCGPCVAMYPQEREIVKRFENQPFAAISVMTDENVSTVRTAIEKGEITWRCWYDGGTDGPIVAEWGVFAFPTIYILDDKGVIRHRNPHGKSLDDALEKLVSEAVSNSTGSK